MGTSRQVAKKEGCAQLWAHLPAGTCPLLCSRAWRMFQVSEEMFQASEEMVQQENWIRGEVQNTGPSCMSWALISQNRHWPYRTIMTMSVLTS